MKAPTANSITQKQHGQFNAVDYSSRPDVDFYAPEDGEITSYGAAGDCGNNLQMQGATGRHGFCHLEKAYVTVGQKVKKGQKLGKMGYTGKTIPPGEGGRHLHWVIKLSNGTYVYPPSKVNEPFEEDTMTVPDTDVWYARYAKFYSQFDLPLSREEFRKNIVGDDAFNAVTKVSDGPNGGVLAAAKFAAKFNGDIAEARFQQEKRIADLVGVSNPDDTDGIVAKIKDLANNTQYELIDTPVYRKKG